MENSLLSDIEKYYDDKILAHGDTPLGVDWNGSDSQSLRFSQLLKVVTRKNFSLADLGCGYGALYSFIKHQTNEFQYFGYDISDEMLLHAKRRNADATNVHFTKSDRLLEKVDYALASGIFNVRQTNTDKDWYDYIITTLNNLNDYSALGFSFNCLTKYSDEPKMKSHLYYADPGQLFDYCKRHFSRNVALLHDYNLYEFTIIVRK